MFTSLVTLEDSWQLVCHEGILRYRYTATGQPMVNLQSYKAAIDHSGRLHIVVTLLDGRLIYARWQGQRWVSSGLPVAGTLLLLTLDSLGHPHLLLTGSRGRATHHLCRNDNHWRQQVLPFHLAGPPLLLKPLPQGRLFLAGQEAGKGKGHVLVTIYNPTTAWQAPQILLDTELAVQRYGYWYQSHLYLLSWRQQESGYQLHLIKVNSADNTILSSLSPGVVNDLPDDRPVLIGQGDTLLFIWTSSNRLAYCFSQDNGHSWSSPQSAYFFFPARIRLVEGPDGPSTEQVAFTKISGLELDWPLLINFKPLFSLCKAVLTQQAGGKSSWKQ
ncbi:hypothetical protein SDD30_14325 [Moorella naiadis]|uniref:hypothetical protein n=1 Tax=Moorella naiadis (nom. illeg.) TaxID=3093670 RepID=UPI003D9C9D03